MVPVTQVSQPTGGHLRLWLLVLLAPVAWVAALGVLYALVDLACVTRSRGEMGWVAASCVLLAALPGLLAWPWRRRIANQRTDAGERTRFMLDLAIGGSALFTLVNLLTALPIAWLDPCRT